MKLFTVSSPLLAIVVGALLSLTGACTARATFGGTAAYSQPEPRLVAIGPGIWVVEDSPDSVFYSDGYYWRYSGGSWYRSSYIDDSFVRVRVHALPVGIRRIDRPRRYRHYRARGGVRARTVPRSHVRGRSSSRFRGSDRGRSRSAPTRVDHRRDRGSTRVERRRDRTPTRVDHRRDRAPASRRSVDHRDDRARSHKRDSRDRGDRRRRDRDD